MGERILAAMSGGVDSSVAASLLLDAGHDVVGARMLVWGDPDEGAGAGEKSAGLRRDIGDARAVADQLGIPFHLFDFRKEFEETVVRPFVRDYLEGRTPNPCVRCNPTMKLGLLLDRARELGCEALATGHYVKIDRREDGRRGIRRGDEPNREQSYYLHRLSQEQLARFRTPLGRWNKEDVRRQAAKRGLRVASKPGSQEICFIPDNDYRTFVRGHPLAGKSSKRAGEIVDREGRVLGRHDGIMNYTIGQRRGLGIAHSEPLYVIGIDCAADRVIVGEKGKVFARALIASGLNWVSVLPPPEPFDALVQIRYRHEAAPARVEPAGDGRIRIEFREPQAAVTPGQAAVLYDLQNDWLLGGGWIEAAEDSEAAGKSVPRPERA